MSLLSMRRLPVAVLAGLTMACAGESGAPPHGVPTASGDTFVEVTAPAGGIPLNEYFGLDLEVRTRSGEAYTGELVVDADMPGHNHGMNSRPVARQVKPGHYRVEGMLFHMPGKWEVYVDVMTDGLPDRAVWPAQVSW